MQCSVEGVSMQSKAEKKQGCPKGPPPDAVHMSSKLVGSEPVHNTQKLPAAADTQDETRQDISRPGPNTSTDSGSDARDDI